MEPINKNILELNEFSTKYPFMTDRIMVTTEQGKKIDELIEEVNKLKERIDKLLLVKLV